jgi:hypothetical protein
MYSGRVTRNEFFSSFQELIEHPESKREFRQLINLSEVTAFEPSYQDLSAIRVHHDPFSNHEKRALVAPRKRLVWSGAHVSTTGKHTANGLFDSLSDALAWLQLEIVVLDGAANRVSTTRTGTSSEAMSIPNNAPATFQQTKRRRRKGSSV